MNIFFFNLIFYLLNPDEASFIEFSSRAFGVPVDKKEYVMNPGDSVLIIINSYTSYSYPTMVTPSGELLLFTPTGYQVRTGELTLGGIRLLDLNPVDAAYVAGLTVEEAEKELKKIAKKYLGNPQVKIIILRPSIAKVYIIGNVNKPGVYLGTSMMRVSEVLAMAGLSYLASFHVKIINKNDTTEINLKKFYKNGDVKSNPRITPGSIIYVPKAKDYIYITGGVIPPWMVELKEFFISQITDTTGIRTRRESWIYEIDRGETLRDILEYMQGIQTNVNLQSCYVQRNGEKRFFSLRDVLSGKQNISLKAGDTVVFPIKSSMIYVAGEVKKPGRFFYDEARTVGEYIGVAGGLIYTADVRNIQLISPTGEVKKANPGEIPPPGYTIFVPRRPIYTWRDAITFAASLISLLVAIMGFGK